MDLVQQLTQYQSDASQFESLDTALLHAQTRARRHERRANDYESVLYSGILRAVQELLELSKRESSSARTAASSSSSSPSSVSTSITQSLMTPFQFAKLRFDAIARFATPLILIAHRGMSDVASDQCTPVSLSVAGSPVPSTRSLHAPDTGNEPRALLPASHSLSHSLARQAEQPAALSIAVPSVSPLPSDDASPVARTAGTAGLLSPPRDDEVRHLLQELDAASLLDLGLQPTPKPPDSSERDPGTTMGTQHSHTHGAREQDTEMVQQEESVRYRVLLDYIESVRAKMELPPLFEGEPSGVSGDLPAEQAMGGCLLLQAALCHTEQRLAEAYQHMEYQERYTERLAERHRHLQLLHAAARRRLKQAHLTNARLDSKNQQLTRDLARYKEALVQARNAAAHYKHLAHRYGYNGSSRSLASSDRSDTTKKPSGGYSLVSLFSTVQLIVGVSVLVAVSWRRIALWLSRKFYAIWPNSRYISSLDRLLSS